jgi:hypothetical protein
MNRSELQNLIDTCHTEADLQLPEFRTLAELIATDPAAQACWEKSQQLDAEIRQVVRDVPVPSGLESRLLAALALSDPASPVESHAPSPADIAVVTRRTWNWQALVAGLTGIAAILVVGFLVWPSNEPQLANEEQAVTQTVQWIEQLDHAAWNGAAAPQHFVLPVQLHHAPSRWQSVPARSRSPRIVCYDLSSARSKVYLFVVPTPEATNLPAVPPSTTYPRGSWHVAAWQAPKNGGRLVYLLAIEHDSRLYQRLMGRPSNIAAVIKGLWSAAI